MKTTTEPRKPLTFEVPPGATATTCRSCGEPVVWIVTKTGKKMPVEVSTKESHFANCPHAGAWRKPR